MAIRLLFCLLLLGLMHKSAGAQLNQEDMSDKDIQAFLSGNTIGAHDWGTENSFEYHSPDGRAIWKEGEELLHGIYRIKNNQVCYAYEREHEAESDRWFCWDFKLDRRSRDIYQWSDGNYYRLYVLGFGNLVSEG